ncbi:MAG: hypothetical protein AAF126_12930, partial [Chloroflexota bacterium]
ALRERIFANPEEKNWRSAPLAEIIDHIIVIWRFIQYNRMLWFDEDVRESAVSTLTLVPEN